MGVKFQEIKDLNKLELRKKIQGLRGDFFKARMENSIGRLSNSLSLRHMRRDVARLKTALAQKSRQGQ